MNISNIVEEIEKEKKKYDEGLDERIEKEADRVVKKVIENIKNDIKNKRYETEYRGHFFQKKSIRVIKGEMENIVISPDYEGYTPKFSKSCSDWDFDRWIVRSQKEREKFANCIACKLTQEGINHKIVEYERRHYYKYGSRKYYKESFYYIEYEVEI